MGNAVHLHRKMNARESQVKRRPGVLPWLPGIQCDTVNTTLKDMTVDKTTSPNEDAMSRELLQAVASIDSSADEPKITGESLGTTLTYDHQISNGNTTSDVQYILLQPGQTLADVNLLHQNSLDVDQSQVKVLYLNQDGQCLNVQSYPTTSPPQSFPLDLSTSNVKYVTSDIQAVGDSRQANSGSPPIPIPEDRDKDIVPGTHDRYRTPGSSFLNKSGNIKRPMNAFMVWARTYRAKLASQFQTDTNSQISIKLGDVWNSLSAVEKQPYYDEAERIKNEHKKEFPGWVYRPSPSKRKQEENPTHNIMWARFGSTSSAATLARIASAAANQLPLDSVTNDVLIKVTSEEPKVNQQKPTLLSFPLCPKPPENLPEKHLASRLLESTEKSKPITEGDSQMKTPTPATQEVLKAKLCSSGRKLDGTKTEKSDRSKSKQDQTHLKDASAGDATRGSSRDPQVIVKKKKKLGRKCLSAGSDRESCSSNTLSRSPTTPPSTPRSFQSDDQTTSVSSADLAPVSNKCQSEVTRESSGDSLNVETSPLTKDGWPFSFPPFRYGPFDHLSPREVPSDEFLGIGRQEFDSDEDSAHPQKVTSDIYLDIHGWKALLKSSVSNSKLTDGYVNDLFERTTCEHGSECHVCTSDLDLAPKPLRDTLRRQHEERILSEEHIAEKSSSIISKLDGNRAANESRATECFQTVDELSRGSRMVRPHSHSSSPVKDPYVDRISYGPIRREFSDSEPSSTDSDTGIYITSSVDVELHPGITTHIVFNKPSNATDDTESSTYDNVPERSSTQTSAGMQILAQIVDHEDDVKMDAYTPSASTSSTTDTDILSNSDVMTVCIQKRGSLSKLTQRCSHINKTDNNTGSNHSELVPEMIPLLPPRSGDSGRRSRRDMQHTNLHFNNITKKNSQKVGASPNARQTVRLKSAQLPRKGGSLKLGDDNSRKMECKSTGNMSGHDLVGGISPALGVTGLNLSYKEAIRRFADRNCYSRKSSFIKEISQKASSGSCLGNASTDQDVSHTVASKRQGQAATSNDVNSQSEKMFRELQKPEKDVPAQAIKERVTRSRRCHGRTRANTTARMYCMNQVQMVMPKRKSGGVHIKTRR